MVIGALLAVLATAGCGAETEPDADTSASDAAPATTAAASASPSSDSTSSPAPSSPAPEATGANGDDHESCNDGECEVSFSGSVEFPLGGADGQWTVVAVVADDGVEVDLTKPDGLGGGGGLLYQPGCTLETRADGSGSLACAEGGEEPPEPEAGGIVVHLLELNGGTAVVRAALG